MSNDTTKTTEKQIEALNIVGEMIGDPDLDCMQCQCGRWVLDSGEVAICWECAAKEQEAQLALKDARIRELEEEVAHIKKYANALLEKHHDSDAERDALKARLQELEAKLPRYADTGEVFVPGVDVCWVVWCEERCSPPMTTVHQSHPRWMSYPESIMEWCDVDLNGNPSDPWTGDFYSTQEAAQAAADWESEDETPAPGSAPGSVDPNGLHERLLILQEIADQCRDLGPQEPRPNGKEVAYQPCCPICTTATDRGHLESCPYGRLDKLPPLAPDAPDQGPITPSYEQKEGGE